MKDMYVPEGFSIITEPCADHVTYEQMVRCNECIEKALRLNRLAYETTTADLRRHEGLERPYESEDTSDPRQTVNIGDGMTEALTLRLSNSYIKEEEDSIYSHNLRNTLKSCAWCNLMTAQPNGQCSECAKSTNATAVKALYKEHASDTEVQAKYAKYLRTYAYSSII